MLKFRFANAKDVDLYFRWANDSLVRKNSYHSKEIDYVNHYSWFEKRLSSQDFYLYIFSDEESRPVGQVRIEVNKSYDQPTAFISISIDLDHRGKGYSYEMIKAASDDFLCKHASYQIVANVFKENRISYQSFIKAGYQVKCEEIIQDIPSYVLWKYH